MLLHERVEHGLVRRARDVDRGGDEARRGRGGGHASTSAHRVPASSPWVFRWFSMARPGGDLAAPWRGGGPGPRGRPPYPGPARRHVTTCRADRADRSSLMPPNEERSTMERPPYLPAAGCSMRVRRPAPTARAHPLRPLSPLRPSPSPLPSLRFPLPLPSLSSLQSPPRRRRSSAPTPHPRARRAPRPLRWRSGSRPGCRRSTRACSSTSRRRAAPAHPPPRVERPRLGEALAGRWATRRPEGRAWGLGAPSAAAAVLATGRRRRPFPRPDRARRRGPWPCAAAGGEVGVAGHLVHHGAHEVERRVPGRALDGAAVGADRGLLVALRVLGWPTTARPAGHAARLPGARAQRAMRVVVLLPTWTVLLPTLLPTWVETAGTLCQRPVGQVVEITRSRSR